VERAVGAEDAMAGDEQRQRVRGHNAANGARSAGTPDLRGQLAVAQRLAGRDAHAFLHHGAAKRRDASPV